MLKCNKASEAAANIWWLCSPSSDVDLAACVLGAHGNVYDGGDDVADTLGVRPTLKLNLESVIFSSESKKSRWDQRKKHRQSPHLT